MIDYHALITKLEQLTTSLEAAVMRHDFEIASDIMSLRLALLESLILNPIKDPALTKELQDLIVKLDVKEKKITSLLMIEKDVIINKLHNIMDGNKASQIYYNNR